MMVMCFLRVDLENVELFEIFHILEGLGDKVAQLMKPEDAHLKLLLVTIRQCHLCQDRWPQRHTLCTFFFYCEKLGQQERQRQRKR